jgi:hypothetical protein
MKYDKRQFNRKREQHGGRMTSTLSSEIFTVKEEVHKMTSNCFRKAHSKCKSNNCTCRCHKNE